MTLTKAGIVQELYKNHENMTKEQAVEAVESFLRLSKDTLIDGSDLLFSGFGKFQVKDKAPRKGRNPQTGEDLMLEGRRVVTFNPSGISQIKLIEQNKDDRIKTRRACQTRGDILFVIDLLRFERSKDRRSCFCF